MPPKRYPGVCEASWSNFSSGCSATSRGSVVAPPSGFAPPARICEAMNAADATNVGIIAVSSTSRLRPRRSNKSASASSRVRRLRCSPSLEGSSHNDRADCRGDLDHRRCDCHPLRKRLFAGLVLSRRHSRPRCNAGSRVRVTEQERYGVGRPYLERTLVCRRCVSFPREVGAERLRQRAAETGGRLRRS